MDGKNSSINILRFNINKLDIILYFIKLKPAHKNQDVRKRVTVLIFIIKIEGIIGC